MADVKKTYKTNIALAGGRHRPFRLLFAALIALVILTAGVIAGKLIFGRSSVVSGTDDAAVVKSVGKLMKLPNETPTVITLDDDSKIKSTAFFADAQTGDKVLIYPTAAKTIIYRPSQNLIINAGPIINDSNSSDNSGSSSGS